MSKYQRIDDAEFENEHVAFAYDDDEAVAEMHSLTTAASHPIFTEATKNSVNNFTLNHSNSFTANNNNFSTHYAKENVNHNNSETVYAQVNSNYHKHPADNSHNMNTTLYNGSQQQQQQQHNHHHHQQQHHDNNDDDTENFLQHHSQFSIDADENTMDVPLLQQNNNYNNNNDFENSPCLCKIAGFAANLKNKSAQEAKTKIILASLMCCVFMIIEFVGGYLAGSLAIMTDAAHLASDCISFVIGLVAIWLSGRPPDRRMSFGYKRMEVLGAIISILGIWILTGTLVMVAIQRIYSSDYDLNANTMMTISGIGILINIAMIFILHGSSFLPHIHSHSHSHSHSHGHEHGHSHSHNAAADSSSLQFHSMNSNENAALETIGSSPKHNNSTHSEKNMNLRAAMIHVIGDLVQSIGVFLAAVLIKFYPSAKFADPLCTLIFSIIVIMTTVRLFKESVLILMDAVPEVVNMDELEMDISNIEGVKGVHHLNVWQHTSGYAVMMVHLLIDFLSDSNEILQQATQVSQGSKYNIKHCTIQIERLSS